MCNVLIKLSLGLYLELLFSMNVFPALLLSHPQIFAHFGWMATVVDSSEYGNFYYGYPVYYFLLFRILIWEFNFRNAPFKD